MLQTNFKYARALFFGMLLFALSYLLTREIFEPIRTQQYFNITRNYSVRVILLMLITIYVFAFTVGLWGTWNQYVFVALPPVLGLSVVAVWINPAYGGVIAVVLYLILSLGLIKSTGIKNLLTKFKPSYILRYSTNSLLFAFSAIGGLMLIMYSSSLPEFNVAQNLTGMVGPQVKQLVLKQLAGQSLVQNYVESININSLVEAEINKFVTPYKNLVNPILAILMFFLFEFYANIAAFLFSITVDPVFWILRKTGLLKVSIEMVEKEVVTF